jgi:hypothetical protein
MDSITAIVCKAMGCAGLAEFSLVLPQLLETAVD